MVGRGLPVLANFSPLVTPYGDAVLNLNFFAFFLRDSTDGNSIFASVDTGRPWVLGQRLIERRGNIMHHLQSNVKCKRLIFLHTCAAFSKLLCVQEVVTHFIE